MQGGISGGDGVYACECGEGVGGGGGGDLLRTLLWNRTPYKLTLYS